jgi:acyl transferase domain-containing protein
MSDEYAASGSDVAVVGVGCRFGGVVGVDGFWSLLVGGVEGLRRFGVSELSGVDGFGGAEGVTGLVPVKGFFPGADLFDAEFFGFSPGDAAVLDPQQRVFLECSWEALEDAGLPPGDGGGVVGVYAGSSAGTYLLRSLRELAARPDFMEIALGNDKDQLAGRVCYKLGLSGPAVVVQTACSTSLVAVHLAVQGLLAGDCDVALAGGVSLSFPAVDGYVYSPDGINASDGHCRSFDALADGTVPGDGVGVVVLKLLDDAVRDGDRVRAVIKGSAINNDGAGKVGYTAPSVAGQAAVIGAALGVAGVTPDSIGYVEGHGTGTALGDPVEVAALTRAYRGAGAGGGGGSQWCGLGSVKSNLGHLDAAAGIAGFIKTVLALEHEVIPASLHITDPNPAMQLPQTPFYLTSEATPWPRSEGRPRRAGVSSFGIGGTNAHVILEEAPTTPTPTPTGAGAGAGAGREELVVLSARTPAALDEVTERFCRHLREHPDLDLADVAHTLQTRRKHLDHRRYAVGSTHHDILEQLTTPAPDTRGSQPAPIALLFPGQGAQHPAMAAHLYASEPTFRADIDACCDLTDPALRTDLRTALLDPSTRAGVGARIDDTDVAQPALFAIEYATARLWQHWGVQPAALLGHSLGEYVAACIAGIFTLPDALTIITHRGRLMHDTPPGAMLAVELPEPDLHLPDQLHLAAVNAENLCVVAGPEPAITTYQQRLHDHHVTTRRLHTKHAFHTPAMHTAAQRLGRLLTTIPAKAPSIPIVSDTTGTWLTPEQATDPAYWTAHTLQPVRFHQALSTLLSHTLIEAGPGHTLTRLARRHPHTHLALPTLHHPTNTNTTNSDTTNSDTATIHHTIGTLWQTHHPITIPQHPHQPNRPPRHTPLPTYPFQHHSHWNTDLAGPPPPDTQPHKPTTPPHHHQQHTTPLEHDLTTIWTQLLGTTNPIHPTDDFFHLGGHSLLGTRLIAQLTERYHIPIRLRDLFAAPTVRGLAATITALQELPVAGTGGSDDDEEGEL